MKSRSLTFRKLTNRIITLVSSFSALIGITALVWILYSVLQKGVFAFNFDFFTHRPTPPGIPGGGVANAIVGSLLITALATLIGVPSGLLAGIYLSEFGSRTKLGALVRFSVNVMMGIPSIIVGLFVYAIIVIPMKSFSGYAGAVALAIIMFPVVARTTEDMLTLVPNSLRESALSLGAPRWKVTLQVIFRAAKAGIITGVLLAVARVSGETAPLLFTALNSTYWPESMSKPVANLTVTIFNFAMSPYRDWQQMAWGASLLIMMAVLLLTIFARWILKESKR